MARIRNAAKALVAWVAGRSVFEAGHYRASENSRLMNLFAHACLERYRGMKMLEVGAGLGEFGDAFRAIGFDVTSSDGREENVQRMRARGRDAVLLDLETARAEDMAGYDVILSFGVLYHLSNPGEHLQACGNARALFLETVVCDSPEPVCNNVREAGGWRGEDQAVSGLGCRPSPAWIEARLREAGFTRVRDISSPLGNWTYGVYDWSPRGDGAWRRGEENLRKMWICERD